jgi:hypothetical protein
MGTDAPPQPARPRLNPYARALRRERIFSQLRLGSSYAAIAREERLSEQRVRQIVTDAVRRQAIYSFILSRDAKHRVSKDDLAGGAVRALLERPFASLRAGSSRRVAPRRRCPGRRAEGVANEFLIRA